MLADARPALLVVRLQLGRGQRVRGRHDHVAGLEHEGHRVRHLVRLGGIRAAGLVEGRGVRSVLGHTANAILTVSQEVERRFNQGLDRPVAAHVYNSFDRETFDPERVTPSKVREDLGIAPDTIAEVLARFGDSNADNPGRLQRWTLGGVEVLLDYAHNPDGLRGLLEVAQGLRRGGRLALLLGHAGNRLDADFHALAAVAAEAEPDRVWLKDIGGDYLRGRASGEVAAILFGALRAAGMPADRLPVCLDEAEAAREALQWARPGDLLVLPVHEPARRDAVVALLDRLRTEGWRAGQALPED